MHTKPIKNLSKLAGLALLGLPVTAATYADNPASLTAEVNIQSSINITIPTNSVSLDLNPFTQSFNTADLSVTVATNNPTGYTLTMSPSDGTTTSLTRQGAEATPSTIDTLDGTYTETDFSNLSSAWGYKLSSDTNYLPFTTSNEIGSNDSPTNGDSNTITFAAKTDAEKPAGTYELSLDFTATMNPLPVYLYDIIAGQSRGPQTSSELLATITQANSGVYEYSPSTFGEASDASNNNKIYYYRGILDSNLDGTYNTYGSGGDGLLHPNYVKLNNDTCWRVIRTTGSGGIKMIYNGVYGAEVTGSCANAESENSISTRAFNSMIEDESEDQYSNPSLVGYTYNGNLPLTFSNLDINTVLGDSQHIDLNNTRSTIKTYIEDVWYANNMTEYTDMLEPNAGYCNDRSAFTSRDGKTAATTASTTVTTSSEGTIKYGPAVRNINKPNLPSLNCPRGEVDLYRYVGNSEGIGNELKYPVALITADEASFAGDGNNNGTTYNFNSFLGNGSEQQTLSPDGFVYMLGKTGGASTERIYPRAFLQNNYSHSRATVRPVISLKSGTSVTSGSGTATDPWIIRE